MKALTQLLQALREPAAMASFDADTWDIVVRQAAGAGLLGRLAALAQREGIEARLPPAVWRHMRAFLTVAEQQRRAVLWELVQLTRSLAAVEGPVLLLKGAAYVAADLPPAPGRVFSDIDIMVRRSSLDATEAALMLDGWNSASHDDYDQRYYRRWMHELPPMMHIRRQTVLDVHHTILPETARIRTRPEAIIDAARRLADFPRFCVPCDADLVLHGATHLFHEGEWQQGLRNLADLDALLRSFGSRPGFWDELLARASTLNLGRPLFYGLRYARRFLATPIPPHVEARCPGRPPRIMLAGMDALFRGGFACAHHSSRTPFAVLASAALYLRSHWLRMPMRLLLPHLAYKFWQARWKPADTATA
jgi:hypothetical protein